MSLVKMAASMKFFTLRRTIEVYPPFLFMGVKVREISDDHRRLKAYLPLRWYAKNQHGTMFGGFMCALSDPLPPLMCRKVFPGTEIWTKSNCVEFLRPGHGGLELEIEITDGDVDAINRALAASGRATHVFEFYFRDSERRAVARVRNTIHVRRRG